MLRGLASALWFLAATLATHGPAFDAPSRGSGVGHAGGADHGSLVPVSPGPLPFFYDLFTFRGDRGSTTVVAAVAVPAGRLRRERRDDRVRYRFDVRFVLTDTARLSVFNTEDSVFVSLPRALPRQHLLHTFLEVQAAPSTATLQRLIVTDATRPGVGQLYSTPFQIPDYSGRELMLSDIAFGLPDAEAGWTRRGVTLALLPTSQFPESSFDVYYEIYNLPAGNPYETEIAVETLYSDGEDQDGESVRTLFSGESAAGPDGSLAELRRVESALPEGRYRLTVTVRDKVSGRVAARSRLVDVRGGQGGTTLVFALPYGSRAPGA